MNLTVILACLWVFLGVFTAILPIRHQKWTGLPLLLSAPFLIWALGQEFGFWAVLVALFAFLSMMRHPLRYLAKRAMGQKVELPKEFYEGAKK